MLIWLMSKARCLSSQLWSMLCLKVGLLRGLMRSNSSLISSSSDLLQLVEFKHLEICFKISSFLLSLISRCYLSFSYKSLLPISSRKSNNSYQEEIGQILKTIGMGLRKWKNSNISLPNYFNSWSKLVK